MAKTGRPGVPAQIKELSGTIRKDRIREGIDFDLVVEVPKPEVWLDPRAKKYFINACQLLIEKRLLNVANVQLVLIMAQEFATYEEATRELKKTGAVKNTAKGYPIQSPWVGIRNQAAKNYKEIASLFGMDPLSQQKIGPVSRDQGDEFDKLLRKHDEI